MTDSDRRDSDRRDVGGGQDPGRRSVAVVDVDGVVADVRHRLWFLRQTPGDWEGFFAAADADPPLPDGLALVRELSQTHDVVWLTGRPERSRHVTTTWLAGHGLPTDEILMRPDADHRPARLFKRAELRRMARSRKIAVVVDDDPEVVALLRSDGWPIELADWVPYQAVLGRAQETEGRT